MTCNELRIGNLICSDVTGVVFKVSKISKNKVNGNFNINKVQPIPINEKWLIKVGFEYDSNCNLYSKSGFDVQLLDNGIEFYLPTYGGYYNWIESLHELQNIYFALTGQELTIK